MLDLHTHAIPKSHLADCRRHSMAIQSVGGNNIAILNVLVELSILIHHLSIYRQTVGVLLNPKPYKLITRCFQFRCNHIPGFRNINCKRNKGRRYIDILERTGHTVLSSDRW